MFKRILCAFIIIIVTSSFIGCSKTKEYHSTTNDSIDVDTFIEDIKAQAESSKHTEVEIEPACRHDGIYGIIITVPDLLIITIVSAVILVFFIFYRNKVSKRHNEVKWRV